MLYTTKPPGTQASIIQCLPQAKISWEGCGRKDIQHKNGGMMEVGAPIVQRIVGASASIMFPCTIKSRRWRAIMQEVDKECSEFYVTVGTATRTSGILIHSRTKALAVDLSRSSGRLWLYAGVMGSHNPRWLKADLVVCANPSSSSSWV